MMQIVPGQNERQLVAAVVEALGLPLGALGEVTVDGFSIRNSDALMNADDIVFEPTEIPAGTLAPSHSEDTLSFPPEGAPAMNKAAPHTAAAAAPAAATSAVPEAPSEATDPPAAKKQKLMPDADATLVADVRTYMKANKLSQVTVGQEVHISQTVISQWLSLKYHGRNVKVRIPPPPPSRLVPHARAVP
jgi:hypothetical protein